MQILTFSLISVVLGEIRGFKLVISWFSPVFPGLTMAILLWNVGVQLSAKPRYSSHRVDSEEKFYKYHF